MTIASPNNLQASAKDNQAAFNSRYIVKVGDTLNSLCKTYISLTQKQCALRLSAHNQIDDKDLIFPSQVILIPVSWLKNANPQGKITQVKGQAQLARYPDYDSLEVATGMPLFTGDQLQIVEGYTQFSLNQNTIRSVVEAPAELLLLSQTLTQADQGLVSDTNNQTIIQMKTGAIRSEVNKNAGQRLQIQSVPVMATVRGTTLYLQTHAPSGVGVMQGLVEVASEQSSSQEPILLPAGKFTVVKDSGELSQVQSLPDAPEIYTAKSVHLKQKKQHDRTVEYLKLSWQKVPAQQYQVELYNEAGKLLAKKIERAAFVMFEGIMPGKYEVRIAAQNSQGYAGAASRKWLEVQPVRESVLTLWDYLAMALNGLLFLL